MEADDAKRIKEPAKHNATMKRQLAEAELEKAALNASQGVKRTGGSPFRRVREGCQRHWSAGLGSPPAEVFVLSVGVYVFCSSMPSRPHGVGALLVAFRRSGM